MTQNPAPQQNAQHGHSASGAGSQYRPAGPTGWPGSSAPTAFHILWVLTIISAVFAVVTLIRLVAFYNMARELDTASTTFGFVFAIILLVIAVGGYGATIAGLWLRQVWGRLAGLGGVALGLLSVLIYSILLLTMFGAASREMQRFVGQGFSGTAFTFVMETAATFLVINGFWVYYALRPEVTRYLRSFVKPKPQQPQAPGYPQQGAQGHYPQQGYQPQQGQPQGYGYPAQNQPAQNQPAQNQPGQGQPQPGYPQGGQQQPGQAPQPGGQPPQQ